MLDYFLLMCLRIKSAGKKPQDFVVTGIPRSGTSLISALLTTKTDDCVCLNEVFYHVPTLPVFFHRMRKRLLAGHPVPTKIDDSGRLITSTNDKNKHSIREQVILIKNNRVVIGSKVTVPYLNKIDAILRQGYKVIAMVRDPVYTLGSWNSKKLSDTPMNKVTDDNLHPHWRNIEFLSANKNERQAQIWEHYAKLIWSLRKQLMILRYEDFIKGPQRELQLMADFLGVHISTPIESFNDRNSAASYGDLEHIRECTQRLCPSRVHFGYV